MRCSPARFLCPWDFLGKTTGVICHSLLQGIFPAQGWNPHLLHCRRVPYHWPTREAQWEADLELKARTASSLSASSARTSHLVIVRIVSKTLPWVSTGLLRSFQILMRFYDPNDASWHPPSSLTECLLLGTHLMYNSFNSDTVFIREVLIASFLYREGSWKERYSNSPGFQVVQLVLVSPGFKKNFFFLVCFLFQH